MHRTVAVAAAAILLAVPGAAWAQDVPVATLDRTTPIAAHGGRLAWSVHEPTTRMWSLVTRVGGVTETVPVPPRAVPFDVDLGPTSDVGTVAVYSRCQRETAPSFGFSPALYDKGRDCDLYRYVFDTAREERLANASAPDANEFWPTVWGFRIAFARTYDAKPGYPYLYTRSLYGSDRSVRQPGGSRSTCSGRSCVRTLSRPIALDLYGRRLGFAWTSTGTGEGLDTDIRLDTIDGGHRRVAHQNGGGLTQVTLGWPAFENGRLHWSITCFGDNSGCPGRYGLRRWRIATGRLERAPATPSVVSHERDAGTTYLVEDEQAGTGCLGDPAVPGGTCTLRGLAPAFAR